VQTLLGRSGVGVLGRAAPGGEGGADLSGSDLYRADGKAFLRRLESQCLLLVLEKAKERPGVADRDAPRVEEIADGSGEAKQAERIRDRGAVAGEAKRDLRLTQLSLEAFDRLGLLQWSQLPTPQVLDEGHLQQLLVGDVAELHWHSCPAGVQSGSATDLPGKHLIALASGPDKQGFEGVALPKTGRELLDA
jgi:hypothetical protein